jgi:hypothetical protein
VEELLAIILEPFVEIFASFLEHWRNGDDGAFNPGAMESFDGED